MKLWVLRMTFLCRWIPKILDKKWIVSLLHYSLHILLSWLPAPLLVYYILPQSRNWTPYSPFKCYEVESRQNWLISVNAAKWCVLYPMGIWPLLLPYQFTATDRKLSTTLLIIPYTYRRTYWVSRLWNLKLCQSYLLSTLKNYFVLPHNIHVTEERKISLYFLWNTLTEVTKGYIWEDNLV